MKGRGSTTPICGVGAACSPNDQSPETWKLRSGTGHPADPIAMPAQWSIITSTSKEWRGREPNSAAALGLLKAVVLGAA